MQTPQNVTFPWKTVRRKIDCWLSSEEKDAFLKTWKSSVISSKCLQRQTLEIVEDFACEAHNLGHIQTFRILSVFIVLVYPCFFFFFFFFDFWMFFLVSFFHVFLSFFHFLDSHKRKNRRNAPVVKNDDFPL